MKLLLLAVGRPRDASLAAATREYETRAARYWPLEVREVREEPARGVAPQQVREREGERLLAAAGAAALVLCDETGDGLTSPEFAAWLQGERERARDVAFAIGGAYGHGERVRAAAARRIALAPWTLPHDLARLVLAEQLYRAGTIVRGEPYHK